MLVVTVAAKTLRVKRHATEDAPWSDRIEVPPKGARSCQTWKSIALPCIAILSLEVIGGVIALVVCCRCRSST